MKPASLKITILFCFRVPHVPHETQGFVASSMKKAFWDDVEVEIVETSKRMLFMQEMNQPKYDKL